MKSFNSKAEDFLFHCQYEKNLSDKTLKAYDIDLKQFSNFLYTNKFSVNLDNINKEIIKKYLKILSDKSPKTAKRKIATIKAMFNFLEFEDEISINPFRKIRIQIKEPVQLPDTMTFSEVSKILKSAYLNKNKISNILSYSYKEVIRDIAVLELLFATGIRVSELCQLQPKNIDLISGEVIVNGKGRKERLIQICEKEVIQALKQYHTLLRKEIHEKDMFFINRLNKPLSPQSVRFMVRKYANQAKINKHITPHTFRHTFATLLLEQDVDIKYIQHLLGHSSIMTTQIYTHVNKKQQKKILRTKHPRRNLVMQDFF